MSAQFDTPEAVMGRAIELARRGIGRVEPNPAVGAVIVDSQLREFGEGHHQQFGGNHAEVNALADCDALPSDAVLYVTLEPCCHHGKTPPCTEAILEAGIRQVVVGMPDPSPHAAGQGIEMLRQAGVSVTVGVLEDQVRRLNAPFVKRVTTGLPYVHAKWAMTLDGKTATRTGDSRWISGEASRRLVHQLRGRMDAIVIGAGTALADDPLLTARPAGPRQATRVVFDTQARLPLSSQLASTAQQTPVLVFVSDAAPDENVRRLEAVGAEVVRCPGHTDAVKNQTRPDPAAALRELASRNMTNVLLEGGGGLLGSFFDQALIDEFHVFVAPKIFGGAKAHIPIGGIGLECVPNPAQLADITIETIESDVYIHGRYDCKAP